MSPFFTSINFEKAVGTIILYILFCTQFKLYDPAVHTENNLNKISG